MLDIILSFRPIQWSVISIAVAIMAGLAIVFAVAIVVISKYMAVNNDNEKFDDVRKLLAGANCGGCGKAGCDDFARGLCDGTSQLEQCNPTSAANKARIADLLEISFADGGEKMAIVNCNGGNLCADKFEYQGYGNCVNQEMLAGGRKACDFGCMGSGSCVSICPENAIKMKDGKSVVDKALCVACGACVKACPKHIISLIPRNAKVYVACSNVNKGKAVMDVCKVGCIGCGLCAKNCEFGAITMVDNLPRIDYSKCTGCGKCVEVCPRKTILKL
ncbi:MAG: RnfABCDGE type electron transport complex subunit B [Clostridia bacterium]